MKILKQLYDWMGSHIDKPYADYLLGLLFYLEAIIFLPTDPILIAYCIKHQSKSFYYATIATLSSVLGGLTGYSVGYALWNSFGQQILMHPMINHFVTPVLFEQIRYQYEQHEGLAILIAGFIPG